ncbi:DoxX family protein [Chachezhania sediminis]|uniref:DoxX family protein n=1 Tax=Chachezhania sediminis TaxID=2599291 RepID=UPI00131B46B4|nr:DoxX family protein [Chachezhania sediminis]
MQTLVTLHNRIFLVLGRADDWIVPTLARFTFAAVLSVYFWSSAMTKLGPGLFGWLNPSSGAFAQMFPKAMEAVSYDQSQLGIGYHLFALVGTWAEFILPALLILGLFTRIGAIGMIVFILVQSYVDVTGHKAAAATIGAWFDRDSGSMIMDQRLLWVTILLVLVIKGAGPISADRALRIA